MNPQDIGTEQDLYEYLNWLGNVLRGLDQSELAQSVELASRFVTGSPSEFLHNAEMALKAVLKTSQNGLSSSQTGDVASVITKIEAAFSRVGGA